MLCLRCWEKIFWNLELKETIWTVILEVATEVVAAVAAFSDLAIYRSLND